MTYLQSPASSAEEVGRRLEGRNTAGKYLARLFHLVLQPLACRSATFVPLLCWQWHVDDTGSCIAKLVETCITHGEYDVICMRASVYLRMHEH